AAGSSCVSTGSDPWTSRGPARTAIQRRPARNGSHDSGRSARKIQPANAVDQIEAASRPTVGKIVVHPGDFRRGDLTAEGAGGDIEAGSPPEGWAPLPRDLVRPRHAPMQRMRSLGPASTPSAGRPRGSGG